MGRKRSQDSDGKLINGLVSGYIHDELVVGSTIAVHMPLGTFVVDEKSTRPVVLLSGGTGITPVLSMLHWLNKHSDRNVNFVHGIRNRALHAFKDEVRSMAERNNRVRVVFVYDEVDSNDILGEHYDEQGPIDAEKLRKYLPQEKSDFYYCGPLPFLHAVDSILDTIDIPQAWRFSEAFAPNPELIIAKTV